MSFAARYRGYCQLCGYPIEVGQQIDIDPDLGSVHAAECPTDKKPPEVCGQCFIQKPCPCADEEGELNA